MTSSASSACASFPARLKKAERFPTYYLFSQSKEGAGMRCLTMLATCAFIAFAPSLAHAQTSSSGSHLLSQLGSRLSILPVPFEPVKDPATRFKPSGRRAMLTAFVNEAASDPDERRSIRTLLETVFTSYESAAAKGRLAHDLAGALAFYI